MIRGGRSYVTSPPAFSNDAKKLLVCTGESVSIFSTSTGLQVASLDGHTALVTTVIVVPATNPASKILCYCWTASLDGTIRYWDFSLSEVVKKIDVRFPVYSMAIPSLLLEPERINDKGFKLFAYVAVEYKNAKADVLGRLLKWNLTDSRVVPRDVTAMKDQKPLIVSPSGKFFGMQKRRAITIWKVPTVETDRAEVKRIALHHTKNLTSIAFHPTQAILAAGDVTGRILIWTNFGSRTFSNGSGMVGGSSISDMEGGDGVHDGDDAESCSTWHWHSSKVTALFFSTDGAYLYSGGKEGVLVVWQLDTGKKKFLPRIGAPLLSFIVSPDPALSSISCADNRILLVKMPSMEILKSISGIQFPCSSQKLYDNIYSKAAFNYNDGLVAFPTENYCIQLYSLYDDRETSKIQVCERNHQPGDEVTVIITLVALSPDASMMCTAEVKLAEEGLGGLVCLKFWTCAERNASFSLTTIVYEPHRDGIISAVVFHPSSRMAVSSSYGGDFKVWISTDGIQQQDQQQDQTIQNPNWTCHAVGSYKNKPITAAAFSVDGSVLAVAAETVITLWDPDTNVIVAIIGESITPIVNLTFIGKSEYLAAVSWGSEPQLSVWSMSKLSMSWSYKLHVEAVACAVDSSLFAALVICPDLSKDTKSDDSKVQEGTQLAKDTKFDNSEVEGVESAEESESDISTIQGGNGVILVFSAVDPNPVATWSVRKPKGGALAFVKPTTSLTSSSEETTTDKKNPPQMQLAYLAGDHEYVLFDPLDSNVPQLGTSHRNANVASVENGNIGYASIYGVLPETDQKHEEKISVATRLSERPWETIFSGPTHALPPLTRLCCSFLESLLEKRSSVVE